MEEAKKIVKVFIDGNDYHATGWYCADRSILIEAGSSVSREIKPSLISGGLTERRIIEEKYLDNYVFKSDYRFNSASSCYSAICGVNNGPRKIVTEYGVSLKDYLDSNIDVVEPNSIEESAESYIDSDIFNEKLKYNKELEKKWEQFLVKFGKDKIMHMTLDDYCEGTKYYKESFCYIMERGYLSGLGSIRNSTADAKFGIHFNKTKGSFTFLKKWGDTKEEAFNNIKKAIYDLLECGETNDIEGVVKNHLSEMFKSKIFFVYFREKALPIYSVSQLDFFIKALGIPCQLDRTNPFEKRRLLIEYKNDSPILSKLSTLEFMQFLYSSYGFKKETDILKKDSKINNYIKETIELLPISELFNRKVKSTSNVIAAKPDYEKIYKNQVALGDLAETKVVQFEKNNNKKYSNKITRLSAYTDSYHYDVLSFDKNGNEKHIEVKTKSGGSAKNIDFHISAKEYETMQKDPAYMIYYVVGLKTGHITIIPINKAMLDTVDLIPESFRVIASSEKQEE